MNRPKARNAIVGLGLVLSGAAVLRLSAAAAEDAVERSANVKVESLSDLKDGETRTFGEAAHLITATRHGDDVKITISGKDDHGVKDLTCSLATDRCTVVTTGGAAPRTMVMLNKSSGEKDGKIEASVQKFVFAGGEGDGPLTINTEGGEPGVFEQVLDLPGDDISWVQAGVPGDQALLRCPQGDTTMRVSKDEAKTAAYRCPKHGDELKEVKGERHVVRIIHREDKEDAKK